MWSEVETTVDETAATALELRELIAMRPPYLRGALAPGWRLPEGERAGRTRSQGMEFDGISPYGPGDDVRVIDWRASARSQTPQVRRFLSQSHRGRMIVVDLPRALFFGTRHRLMAKSVSLAAAHLAWEALMLHEPVGLAIAGKTVEPRRGRRHLLRLLDLLKTAYDDPPDQTDAATMTCDASAAMRSGDEVCLIGEFAEPLVEFAAATQALADVRILRAFLVADPLELGPVRPGTYLARPRTGGPRRSFRVTASAAASGAKIAETARRERVALLRDGGWHVRFVHDLLPWNAGSGP